MDVRNNSAWNHRWFIVFGRRDDQSDGRKLPGGTIDRDEGIYQREIEYAKGAIWEAPQNQSPWNYLRGVLRIRGKGVSELKCFASEFADVEKGDEVRSSHALDFLAEIWAVEEESERAGKALELLAVRYDPIRKNYWNYRRGLLGLAVVGA